MKLYPGPCSFLIPISFTKPYYEILLRVSVYIEKLYGELCCRVVQVSSSWWGCKVTNSIKKITLNVTILGFLPKSFIFMDVALLSCYVNQDEWLNWFGTLIQVLIQRLYAYYTDPTIIYITLIQLVCMYINDPPLYICDTLCLLFWSKYFVFTVLIQPLHIYYTKSDHFGLPFLDEL